MTLYGAIEAGGTKIVCGIGDARSGSRETARFPTEDPATTIERIVDFFGQARGRHGIVMAVGIASFGPLDLDPFSPGHGRITTTPKIGWQGCDLPAQLGERLGVPAMIGTDVNAAALAEATYGAARERATIAYVTVGTGIGVGLVTGGRMVQGPGHPEAGHLMLRRHPAHDGFPGICRYHGDCLEGLASGPAIDAAWGASLSRLAPDHPAWAVQADYLGQLCASLILLISPEHIILGGGVMAQHRLFEGVRAETARRLAGYSALWNASGALEARITPPGCLEPSGLVGAYMLAEQANDPG